jgi:hypothetical protein
MISVAISATAALLQTAREILGAPSRWPDPASALAYRMLIASDLPAPAFASFPVAAPTSAMLRITPEISAYGYLLDQIEHEGRVEWCNAVDHLRGREMYPPDRQTFAFNPLEIVGIAAGLSTLPPDDHRRSWFVEAIRRGFTSSHFRTPLSVFGAAAAVAIVDHDALRHLPSQSLDVPNMSVAELLLVAGIDLAFRCLDPDHAQDIESALLDRILTRPVPLNDVTEAAAAYISALRIRDRTLAPKALMDDLEKVLILCRRFPLLSDTLRKRYGGRQPLEMADEYDVQDLLHGILRLHFDDVRPEEYTPSYAGKHSRVDFLLPRARMVVEAKMTRNGLGQKEVIDQLLIDVGRYSKMDHVDTLVCLVFDPDRKCANPKGIESDVENSGGRLKVRVVVCPQPV